MKLKWLAYALLTIVLISGVLWLSSLGFMSFYGLDLSRARPWSIIQYWMMYGNSANKTLKMVSSAYLFVPWFLIAIAAYVVISDKSKKPLHGAARFASPAEIRKAELLGPLPKPPVTVGDLFNIKKMKDWISFKPSFDKTILIGKHNGNYLTFGGYQFVLLAAPTRSGKGVGVVIPNCLNYSDSLVVLDIKLENYRITSGFRKACGQEVYLFCPFDRDGRSHRYNPLSYVSDDPAFRMGDIDSIANALYPDTNPSEKFWSEQAKDLFRGMALFVLETPKIPHTLGEILRQASGKGQPLKDYLQSVIENRQNSGKPFSDACIDCLSRIINAPDNTFGSIVSTFNTPLKLFQNPLVDMATSDNDFDLRDVRKKRMTVYFGITPDKLGDAAVLVNLFFDQLINLNSRQLPEDDPKVLKYQCLMIMDEFTAIGKVSMIAKSVSYQAGYNMRLLTIIQNKSQLEDVYGKAGAQTLIANHAIRIAYAPSPSVQTDANEYSEMLGYLTVKSTSRSTGRGSSSQSTSDQRRALLMPQEIKDLGENREIIFLDKCKPVLCDKIRYYEDPEFLKRGWGERLKGIWPPSPVPCQSVDLFLAKTENRIRTAKKEDLEADDIGQKIKGLDGLEEKPDFSSLSEEDKNLFIEEEISYVMAEIISSAKSEYAMKGETAEKAFADVFGEEDQTDEEEVIEEENSEDNSGEENTSVSTEDAINSFMNDASSA